MRPLRVLSLEDDPKDTELIQNLLEEEGLRCDLRRVETEDEYVSALDQSGPDLILADYTLPSFDGLSALELAKRKCPNVPFIFVSGTLGEERAIEALKLGATDYVLKARLLRIVACVRRALREAEERMELRRSQEALRRSEAFLAEAQELSHTGSFGLDVASGEFNWSLETFRIFEYDPTARVTIQMATQRTHPDDRSAVEHLFERISRQPTDFDFEHRLLMPDGRVKHVQVKGRPSKDERGSFELVGAVIDITERTLTELKLRRSETSLLRAQRISHTGSWSHDLTSGKVAISPETQRIFGSNPEEDMSNPGFWFDRIHPEDRQRTRELFERSEREKTDYCADYRIILPDGTVRHQHSVGHPVLNEAGNLVEFVGTAVDDTEQWEARIKLEQAFEEIKRLKDRLQNENVVLREQVDRAFMFEEIVGASNALRTVLSRVAKVGPTDTTVLITGETGTGKELIARAIHKSSQRASRAFVSVNCAAIPTSLIASELFGHERGAFTGALQRRVGRFELAEEGTLFLDEIGELPLETQVALLRVLQEKEFERVGGNQALRTNVRVIAATNRDLEAAIAAGTFRRDLYYRLNVFPINVPPLKERKEDIPLLVGYFMQRFARNAGKRFRGMSKTTLDLLLSYPWPGNIRELQNVIERSVIVCDTENFSIDQSWLFQEPASIEPENPQDLAQELAAREREMIESALRESGGRVSGPTGAAAKLGIARSTLESKIRSLTINKYKFKTGD
jgi:PAS domain S-box-containing protein